MSSWACQVGFRAGDQPLFCYFPPSRRGLARMVVSSAVQYLAALRINQQPPTLNPISGISCRVKLPLAGFLLTSGLTLGASLRITKEGPEARDRRRQLRVLGSLSWHSFPGCFVLLVGGISVFTISQMDLFRCDYGQTREFTLSTGEIRRRSRGLDLDSLTHVVSLAHPGGKESVNRTRPSK